MKKILLMVLAAFLNSAEIRAQRWLQALRPDFLQAQFAGNMGLISAGAGYHFFRERLEVAVLDGYLPPRGNIAGINTVNLRAAYDVARIYLPWQTRLSLYAGATGMFETTGHSFYGTPDQYPDQYYKTSAIHALFFAGVKARIPLSARAGSVAFYTETGTVDSYAYYSIINNGRNFTKMFSAALGIQYYLPGSGKH